MESLPKRKVQIVLGLCVALGAVNGVWLLVLKHSDLSRLHGSPFYPIYLSLRDLLLKPITLLAFTVWMAYAVFWVFKRHRRPVRDAQKLAVLALVACSLFGLILLALLRL